MTTVGVVLVITVYPAFSYTLGHLSTVTLFGLVAWLALLKSIYFGALPALMSEIFPTATRSTGMSIAYNVGVTVFGGFTPAVVTWLISATANRSAPSFYLMVTAMISLAALASVSRMKTVRGQTRLGIQASR